jgi:hypothetical protein
MESRSGFTGPLALGNEGEFTIRHLAETIATMVGSDGKGRRAQKNRAYILYLPSCEVPCLAP